MATLKKNNSQFADASGDPLIGERQANVADVTATTTAALSAATPAVMTIAYATDDPGITVDGEINIADGDAALNAAEIIIAIEELMAKINILTTLGIELKVDHATMLTDIANVRTTVASALDVLEEHGLMTAT